ncbi:hypothetical protein ACFWDI_40960 [Streptomyces sp. NPDC060064]|uniref:hypothetical protein n=1 Tax=Streptomyces sp. NPDC060064 TaxID=3347049 RepID=UPI00367C73B2
MSVTINKTTSSSAEITWEPSADDTHGNIVYSIESEQLAYALQALGDEAGAGYDPDIPEARALSAAMHTTRLARALETRAAVQVVHLRDHYGLSWRRIATAIHDDPDMQSTVRRQYDSGLRYLLT